MPWFVVAYDFSPAAAKPCDDFHGLALRYGWDRYKEQDDEFRPLPAHTLTGEFSDYAAARANFMQLCQEADECRCGAPTSIFLLEALRSQVIIRES